MEKGNLSIHSENILPIIKKWLYSDSDIFVRELVSNASDAIMKFKKLTELGEAEAQDEKYAIRVIADKEAKTLTFEDNGIGMTADEIKEYINQIAFSGASAFLEKYQDKMQGGEIIGHFGLGFYSSFMAADRVQIDSLSWQPGAEATLWQCDGGIEYEMSAGTRTTRGTTITLFINEEHEQFLEEYNLRTTLTKYCSFLPVEIFVGETEEHINDTSPLWLKQPNECTDEEYKKFYQQVFIDFNEPLFWIHLNMDYPFRLKGILYFPKLKHELEYSEGQVKLYNNQVFVADNIKEVIPEYLLLLKGVMDCPDLPLNVSRSFLQNDAQVKKMSSYISRKVADKLNSLFKQDREQYQGYWDDISPFIKYGCIREQDFYSKVKASVLYKTTSDDYVTLEEFLERSKTDKKIFYVSNEQLQSQYIKLFKDQGLEAVFLTSQLDNPFISYVENYESEKEIGFNRIDSDLSDALKDSETSENPQQEEIEKFFQQALANEQLKVSIESLKSNTVSAVVLLSEESRRMQEMSRAYGGGMQGMFENQETLVLNDNSKLVQTLFAIKDDPARKEDADMVTMQIYDLAMMSHKPLSNEQMTRFIERSNKLLERVVGN